MQWSVRREKKSKVKSVRVGRGADNLFGGSGEAILNAGTTDYTQPSVNAAALDAIIQEWSRTDLGFNDRMSDLLFGNNNLDLAP